jgi:aminoglycoside N3'-acetyltransferase
MATADEGTRMPVVTSPDQMHAELQSAFNAIEGDSLIIHSDLLRIGYAPKGRRIDQQLAEWLKMVQGVSGGRTLLFPTFNYDFARTGIYRPLTDPGQVGALNEFARQQAPNQRTQTPIFNFVVLNPGGFPLEPSINAFDEDSAFGRVRRAGGSVVFLGSGPESNTFIHHVEEAAGIPYRYLKAFHGVIETGDERRPVRLLYRVRPIEAGIVEYDWHRLAGDLRDREILRGGPLGNSRLESYRAQDLFDYWSECLRRDEHFLLTDASRRRLEALYSAVGKPLTVEAVEGRVRP